MEDKALDTIRIMLGRRGLDTRTSRMTFEDMPESKDIAKKLDKFTCYKVGDTLVCFSQKDKVLANDINNIIAYATHAGFEVATNGAKAGVIIVAMSPPSENVLRLVKSFAKGRLTFFHIWQLQFDIMTHRAVMPHRILSEEEKTAVFEQYKVSNPMNQIPWIDSQDTMAKWIGAIPGDVIEVTRHSDTTGRSLYYRYCVEDVNITQ